MTRPIAAALSVALYPIAIGLACFLNADAILRDAVVGVSLVAGLYAMFFLPTAAAGAAAVSLDGIETQLRPMLAICFAALLFTFLELMFLAGGSQHFGPAVIESGMLVTVGGNIVLILIYFGVGALFARRGKRRRQTAT